MIEFRSIKTHIMKTKLLLLLAFICQISFAQVSDANLVAYYSFDNTLVNAGPGGSNYNLSYFGTGTNPTYLATGGVTGGSINNPGCFEFNTTITLQNSEFFNLLASTNPNQSLSVSYWVYNNQAQNSASIRTHFEAFGSMFSRGGLGWGVSTQNGNFNTTSANLAFTSGVWDHITLVFDASVRRLRMYVNGLATPEVTTTANSIFKYNNKFVIGGGTDGSGENLLTKALSGRIDEMYVFNRALLPTEVTALYNKEIPTSSCPTGNYTATTQAQIDALAGCTSINGNLTISAPNATYLNSLSSLTTVNGNLMIANGTNLTNLDGLSNLTTVTGNLVIGATNISDLNPLTSLTTINGLVLNANNSLTDIQALSNVSGSLTGNIEIMNNQNLTNLNGLQNITQAASLNILQNPVLQNINGLSALTTLTNNFSNTLNIESNPQLSSLNGLNNLVNLPNNGGVRILNNTLLTDISALATISNIAYLEIMDNTNLSTCAIAPICNLLTVSNFNAFISDNGANCFSKAVVQNICDTLANPCPPGNVTFLTQAEVNAFVAQYPNCTEINGLLTINGGNINNLSGLSNITSITNGLTISQCNTLASLNGLQNITTINGNISITNNPLLVNLTGLNSLTSLNNNSSGTLGNIFMNNNSSLTSLDGLQNLTNLTKDNLANTRTGFAIYNCNSLTDISALGNINNAVVEFIVISNNTNLNNCAIATVCNKLAVDTNWVTISGNATGCESIAVVQAECDTLSSSDFELESNLKIYPNPFNSQITFDLGNSYENVAVVIHDITGKQLYKNSFSGNQLVINNLGNLPSGMYVATLTTENGTSITKKIAK